MKRPRWLIAGGVAALIVAALPWSLDALDQPEVTSDARALKSSHRIPTMPSPPSLGDDDAFPHRSPMKNQTIPSGDAGPSSTNDDREALRRRGRDLEVSVWLEVNADLAERTVEQYCAQAMSLRGLEVFEPAGHALDAMAFMSPLSDWEASSEAEPPIHGSLHLPDALALKLRALAPASWPTALTADADGLDFTWMRRLQQFDHWDVGMDPHVAEHLNWWFDAVIPNFETLVHWAKLRLVNGLTQGGVLQAAAEVRHLAKICESTQTLVGLEVGLAMRGFETLVHDLAIQRGLDVSGWPAVLDGAEKIKARQLSRVASLYFYPGVSPRVMRRASECAVGVCPALADAIGAQNALQGFASIDTRWALSDLVSRMGCSGTNAKLAREARPLAADEARVFLDASASGNPLKAFLNASR